MIRSFWRSITDNLTGIFTSWLLAVIAAYFYIPKKAALLAAYALVALVLVQWLNAWLLRRKYRVKTNEAVKFQKSEAVVVTVGLSPELINFIVSGMEPKTVGFICTSASEAVAKEVAKHLNLTEDTVKYALVDPESFQDVMENTKQVFRWLLDVKRVRRDDITVDVTGALTSVSLGAFAASRELGIRSQCVIPNFDAAHKPISVKKVITVCPHP